MLSKSWVSYFLPWLPRDKGKVGPFKECLFGDSVDGDEDDELIVDLPKRKVERLVLS